MTDRSHRKLGPRYAPELPCSIRRVLPGQSRQRHVTLPGGSRIKKVKKLASAAVRSPTVCLEHADRADRSYRALEPAPGPVHELMDGCQCYFWLPVPPARLVRYLNSHRKHFFPALRECPQARIFEGRPRLTPYLFTPSSSTLCLLGSQVCHCKRLGFSYLHNPSFSSHLLSCVCGQGAVSGVGPITY